MSEDLGDDFDTAVEEEMAGDGSAPEGSSDLQPRSLGFEQLLLADGPTGLAGVRAS